MFYYGFFKSNASRGSIICNFQPFLVLFLAHFFIPGDQMTPRKVIGISLGFLGVASMFINDDGITDDIRTGDFFILTAVLLWGCSAIYIKRIIAEFRAFQIALYPIIFVTPFLFCAAYLWDSPMISNLDSYAIGAIFYQGLISASFGFVMWNVLQQRFGVVALHSYIFIMPISGVILGGIILDEPVANLSILLALSLIVIGIVIVHKADDKQKALEK